jgi:hypothetical protein
MARTAFLINLAGATVQIFDSPADAKTRLDEGSVLVTKVAEMENVPSATLTALYNKAALAGGGKEIKKFADRESGNKRTFDALELIATKGTPGEKVANVKTPRKPRAEGESSGRRGRTSSFAGGTLTKQQKENPRREGTHGYNSYALIRDGMKYETFIEKGGRLKDLAWDVAKGYVVVSH